MVYIKKSHTGFPWWIIGIFLCIIISIPYSKPNSSQSVELIEQFDNNKILSLRSNSDLINRVKKLIRNDNRKKTLDNLLDSLGYFNNEINNSNDTIYYNCNIRSELDTIILKTKTKYPLQLTNYLSTITFPQPYNSAIIDNITKNINSIFVENGYPFTNITLSIREESNNVTAILEIKTDEQYCFESPLLNRDLQLNPKTLKNDLLIKRNTLFNTNDIDETLLRLSQRPYIKSVEAKEPVIIPKQYQNKKTDTTSLCNNNVTVPLEIIENSGMGIDGVLGFNSSQSSGKWNGLVNIILQNVLHRGEALTLNYRGEEDLQEFSLTLDKAYPFGIPFLLSGYFDLEVVNEKYGSLLGGLDILTSLKKNLQIGFGVSGHEPTLNNGTSWYSIGFDLILKSINKTYGMNVKKGSFNLRTGSGYKNQSGVKTGQFSFQLSSDAQIPFLTKHAFYGKLFSGAITSSDSKFHETEMIRIGGQNSLRGYAIDEYSFTACAFLQFEYLFYFNKKGSIFLFADGGAGAVEEINIDNSTSLFGYGLGIRVPVRAGRLSLEYARNYKEGKSPGRVHIRIQNSLSKGM